MIDTIVLCFRNIFRKGLRTALTILGVAVGVSSVILINTISNTGIKTVNAELDSLGLNGISISSDNSSILTEDINTVKKQKGVDEAMPILTSKSQITENDITQDIMIWGVDSGVKQVIQIDILFGRSFTKYDINSKENVCLLDESIARKIFKRQNAVGKSISLPLGNTCEQFEIIGITKAGSGMLQSIMGNFIPNFCYIPYSTYQQLTNTNELYQIAVKLDDNNQAKIVSSTIKNALDQEKGIKQSVTIGDLAAQRSTLSSLLDTITAVFSIVGIISLLVAGIGIMTVMLVSVNERKHEIGIKKAIGAKFSSIIYEFLFEALTICILGSIIGSIIGFAVITFGSYILGINTEIVPSSIIISFFSAVFIGVIFGLYPAIKAAKCKPIDALRYE